MKTILKDIGLRFSVLTPAERNVLLARFGFADNPMTLQAVGDLIGVSKERIRQIEYLAIERLAKNEKYETQ